MRAFMTRLFIWFAFSTLVFTVVKGQPRPDLSAVEVKVVDLERRITDIERVGIEHRLTALEADLQTDQHIAYVILTGVVALLGEAFVRVLKRKT